MDQTDYVQPQAEGSGKDNGSTSSRRRNAKTAAGMVPTSANLTSLGSVGSEMNACFVAGQFCWNVNETLTVDVTGGPGETEMTDHGVRRVGDALNDRSMAIKGGCLLVFGPAYKPNVDDDRESPGCVLMDLLKQRGANVAYYDPYVLLDALYAMAGCHE